MSGEESEEAYTIALDPIDVNLLQLTSYVPNRNHKLWSIQNDSPNYYRFDILGKDTETSEDNKTYKCHICNKYIPVGYSEEHNSSSMHRNYLNITNDALKRITMGLNQLIEEVEPTEKGSVYFCETCVLAVEESDRENHEKSRVHKISVLNERLLQDLANIYCGETATIDLDGDQKKAKEHFKEKVVTKNTIEKEDLSYDDLSWDNKDVNPNNVMHYSEREDSIVSKISHTDIITKQVTVSEISDIEVDDTVQHCMQSNTKRDTHSEISDINVDDTVLYSQTRHDAVSDIEVCDTMQQTRDGTVSEISDTQLVNTSRNSIDCETRTEYVFSEDFAGVVSCRNYFREISYRSDPCKIIVTNNGTLRIKTLSSEGYCVCILCVNKEVKDLYEHKYTEGHISGLLLPIGDKNGLRMLDDTFYHCILCNRLVPSTDIFDHGIAGNHIKKMNKALVRGEEFNDFDMPCAATSRRDLGKKALPKTNANDVDQKSTSKNERSWRVAVALKNFNRNIIDKSVRNLPPLQILCSSKNNGVAKENVGIFNKKEFEFTKGEISLIEKIDRHNEVYRCDMDLIKKHTIKEPTMKATSYLVEHLSSTAHSLNFEIYLRKNNLTDTYKGHYCFICNVW